MKKAFMTMFLLSAGSLAMAQSQTQPPPQPQDQQSMPSSSQMARSENVKFTGCLQAGSEPNTYVLYNATSSDMDQSSSQDQDRQDYDRSMDQSQPGETPSGLARTETSFALLPGSNVDLKSHIGHRVEVTGKMMETSSRTNQSSRATTPSGQSSTIHSSTEMSGQPQIKVSSIRQIADTCQ